MPRRNLVPKPAALSFAEAACLPTAYLTAYRMLFDKSGLQPGSTVLIPPDSDHRARVIVPHGAVTGSRTQR